MRRLNKSYPYQKPSKNRSSKNLNIMLGNASVFPNYLAWSDENLAKFAGKCKNKKNCYQETLDTKIKAREAKKARKAARAASAKSAASDKE